MGTVRVLFVTALVFLATTHFRGSVQAKKIRSISPVQQVSAKLRTLRQTGPGDENCTVEEFNEKLLAHSDLPQYCGEFFETVIAEGENTTLSEEEILQASCDIACLRPLTAVLTECFGEEAAETYDLICAKNENDVLCGSLFDIILQDVVFRGVCGELENDVCSDDCSTVLDDFGCCVNSVLALLFPDDADSYVLSWTVCGLEDPGICPSPLDDMPTSPSTSPPEMCTDEEFDEQLFALDLPPKCSEVFRDLVGGNTSITEVETFEPTCDIACLRPLHALLTECYGEEAAGLYELLCSRNENGDLCSLLLSDKAQLQPYVFSIYISCRELIEPGGAGSSCSEACSKSVIDLDDTLGCCLSTILDLAEGDFFSDADDDETTPDPNSDVSEIFETLYGACGVTPPGSCKSPITGGAGAITPSTSATLTAVALLSALFFHFP